MENKYVKDGISFDNKKKSSAHKWREDSKDISL